MNTTNKLVIDARAMDAIRSFAKREFDETLRPLPTPELIVNALYSYIKSKGLEPQFEVKNDPNRR